MTRESEGSAIPDFEAIVGKSAALQRALSQAKTVAPTDASVLISGETGTGKELVARAIHRLSARNAAAFIALNCATLPAELLESELFGYEKGAFTNAVRQKIGRLELADKGTLFLDEIGELPFEVQPKLLRVLQDGEFERLGSTRTIQVDLRLIAASNRNLTRLAAEHQFRNDLFYRLNVFPIHMPPLRVRHTDIPILAWHFVRKFNQRMNKEVATIPDEVMDALLNYRWPGNVRELENFIERSVVLSGGAVLQAPVEELQMHSDPAGTIDGTLMSVRRDHILKVLQETDGIISGAHGAAARLGLKRTTLQSLMQRLGISRRDYQD
jgi:formate hydrogenlyase transcriptional activator